MIELVFEVGQDDADEFSDALFAAGAVSVVIEDALADTEDESPLYGEPGLTPDLPAWTLNRVVAGLSPDLDVSVFLRQARDEFDAPLPAHFQRIVADQDWVRVTQAQFAPICVTPMLWIVPSWHKSFELPARAVGIELDPGLAFGTGSHATTRLCLQWIAENLPQMSSPSVLDYGCGSGILAIAAAKFGASQVLGVDIDPQAVRAAQANGLTNHTVHASFGLPDAAIGRYDVLIANILSNPLKVLAGLLCSHTGGTLVLSGILARQADEIANAYAPWIALSVWREDDGWVCMTGTM
jgi:ribosomal protein L11 methyltransferase